MDLAALDELERRYDGKIPAAALHNLKHPPTLAERLAYAQSEAKLYREALHANLAKADDLLKAGRPVSDNLLSTILMQEKDAMRFTMEATQLGIEVAGAELGKLADVFAGRA